MKYLTFVCFYFFFVFSIEAQGIYPEWHPRFIYVQTVYQNLIQAIGDRRTAPNLTIYTPGNRKNLARYDGVSNRISLGGDLLDIFAKEMGRDSTTSLALVLAHELAHHYNNHSWYHAFAANDKKNSISSEQTYQFESQADEFAVFYAYLAGYDIKPIGQKTLELIYKEFQLSPKNYPSKEQRLAIYQQAVNDLSELSQLFETGQYLLISEHYDIATKCFEYINQYFPAPEVLNNIAYAYLKSSLEYLDSESLPFLFPLSLNETTRLPQSRGSGSKETQYQIRNNLLNQAKHFLYQANSSQESSLTELNLSIFYLLNYLHDKEKNQKALQIAKSHLSIAEHLLERSNPDISTNCNIQKALLLFYDNKQTEAIQLLSNLEKNNSSPLAKWNYQIALGNQPDANSEGFAPCPDQINIPNLNDDQIKKDLRSTNPIIASGSTYELSVCTKKYADTCRTSLLAFNPYNSYDEVEILIKETDVAYPSSFCNFQIGSDFSELLKEYDFDQALISHSLTNTWFYFESIQTIFAFDQNNKLCRIIQTISSK